MNNQSKVIQGNNEVHYFGGKQKEFGRLLSDLKTEFEKFKTIRSRYFRNSDRSLIACSHL